MKQKPQKDLQKDQQPNPLWRRVPAQVSPSGRTAWVDATIITYVAEHYRACKLPMPKGWH